MTKKDDNGMGVLLEQIIGQNQMVLEVVGQMQDQIKLLPEILERLETVESDTQVIKHVVKSSNADQRKLKLPVAKLEAA